MIPGWRCVSLIAFWVAGQRPAVGSMQGGYGFISEYSGITEEEARKRVRLMKSTYGIMEFEFASAFQGYSRPPPENTSAWICAMFKQNVESKILKAYTEEIEKIGGRSWLAIHMDATDPRDKQLQEGTTVLGHAVLTGTILLDVVAANSDWALKIVPAWMQFALMHRFAGIKWESFGGQKGAKDTDIEGFLRTSARLLADYNLKQLCGMVDGFGWAPELVSSGIIDFPFWRIQTLEAEDRFFEQVHSGGVLCDFAGKDEMHADEPWNQHEQGVAPVDLMIKRWRRAYCTGNAYLAIGDGLRRLTTDFYRDAVALGATDTIRVKNEVFTMECEDASGEPVAGRQMVPAVEEKHCKAFGIGDVADEDELTPWENSCRGGMRDGRLRVSIQGDEPQSFLAAHTVVIETAIMGMFHFCCAHIVGIRVVPDPEPLISAENATVTRRLNGGEQQELELVYRGYCHGECRAKPIDNFANFLCSMRYGFVKRDLKFPILDITDPDWEAAPAQHGCKSNSASPLSSSGEVNEREDGDGNSSEASGEGEGEDKGEATTFLGTGFVGSLTDSNDQNFKTHAIVAAAFVLIDIAICVSCVCLGMYIARKRFESNHWIEYAD